MKFNPRSEYNAYVRRRIIENPIYTPNITLCEKQITSELNQYRQKPKNLNRKIKRRKKITSWSVAPPIDIESSPTVQRILLFLFRELIVRHRQYSWKHKGRPCLCFPVTQWTPASPENEVFTPVGVKAPSSTSHTSLYIYTATIWTPLWIYLHSTSQTETGTLTDSQTNGNTWC
jgi:hypothetical protein